jgi:hypothetical protein
MADEELRDLVAAFLRTQIDPQHSQEAQEWFEKEVDRRVNGDLGKSIRLYRDEHGRYPDISEIHELRQQELKKQQEQFAASPECMADKEIRALVRDVLMKGGLLSGEGFERWAKVKEEGTGETREELIERVIDKALPGWGSALKAFHDEHGFYPDWSPQPGGPRLKMY